MKFLTGMTNTRLQGNANRIGRLADRVATRRRFLAAAAAAGLGGSRAFAAGPQDEASGASAPGLPLKALGKVKPVPSRRIEDSPLSVGFEVLDRKRFEPEKTYDHLAALGVKWARCQTGWNRCERAPGEFSFGWLDEVVDSLLNIGIRPWFNLGYGNKLYTPAKPDDTSVGWAPIFDRRAETAWLRFVGELAAHFSDRVSHWEIWNEPNITGFWKPNQPNAADYVRMVRITAPQIRRRVPEATVVGGAFAGIPFSYIEDCLEAGLAELVDRISYHPYRPVPEADYQPQVRKLRAMIARYNPNVKLWQGENGCPSQGGQQSTGALSNLDWNETRQAKWLLRRILSDLRLKLELVSYFHTVDLVGYRGKTNFKGLLRGGDYTRKPAYFAYQCLCSLFDSKTVATNLLPELVGQGRARLQDAIFLREDRAMYAWWFPADLFEPFDAKTITVRLRLPRRTALVEPVLINPLDQQVYRFERVDRASGALTLRDLPLFDYPLIVADRAVVGC